jgi:hypothetical protein
MRKQITLYGEDSEWFEDLQEEVGELRDGNEPANAELVRMMMQQFETDSY